MGTLGDREDATRKRYIGIETSGEEIEMMLRFLDEARVFWSRIARDAGWLTAWEAEGQFVQVWVSPLMDECYDSLYLRRGALADLVIIDCDRYHGRGL